MNKKQNKTYQRVMSRVYNSRANLKSNSVVTRHDMPSSERVGAKPSGSNVSSGAFSELPTFLNDYVPESSPEKVKSSNVVKPKRTLKSLDPAKSPPRIVSKAKELRENPLNFRTLGSEPSVLSREVGWSDSHVRQCYSSRSHTRLKELKDEIKAFRETDKLMKIRSRLYKSCGVVLDDVGHIAEDKAVQAGAPESEKEHRDNRLVNRLVTGTDPVFKWRGVHFSCNYSVLPRRRTGGIYYCGVI